VLLLSAPGAGARVVPELMPERRRRRRRRRLSLSLSLSLSLRCSEPFGGIWLSLSLSLSAL
jgi:hypothetical protein